MKYNYKFQFVPGKQLVLPDALSRVPAPRDSQPVPEEHDAELHAVETLSHLVSDTTMTKLATATAEDKHRPKKTAAAPQEVTMLKRHQPS